MLFLTKTIYYCLFAFSIMLALFLIMTCMNTVLDLPYARASEIFIFLLASLMMVLGVFLSRQVVRKRSLFLKGSLVLGVTWILVLIELLTGLLCFNGPLHWQ